MMKVDSFIKCGEDFIHVTEFSGLLKDADYIEGAMALTINHVEMINLSLWDYIDQLWIYMLNGLIELNSGGDVTFYFPGQPVKVTMSIINNRVLFKVAGAGVIVEKRDFIFFMATECLDFLNKMMSKNGAPDYGVEIKLASDLVRSIKC